MSARFLSPAGLGAKAPEVMTNRKSINMVSESRPDVAAGPQEASPLRILFVVDSHYPDTGGTEKQVRLLTRAFADAGHTVRVVVPRLDTNLPLTDEVDGIPLTRLAYPRIKLLGTVVLSVHYGVWLWRRRHEFDAIHVHMAKNLAAMCGLVRPLIPATMTVKISGAWEFNGGILDPELRGRPLQRLYNWCIRRVDHLQCVSEHTRRMLKDAGYSESLLCMVPNAVDLVRFNPPSREPRELDAPVRVVYVGRIRPVKGLTVLMGAWSKIARQANARLTIAGDGPGREALMQSVRDGGFADSVEFLGEVNDVPSVLAEADIYVQPSFQEGLPNSVLEAMAMGLPIVATRISGNEDVVAHEENGLLVPAGNAEALAEALRKLMDDPALAARMGRRSREIVEERFSLSAVMGRLLKAYREKA